MCNFSSDVYNTHKKIQGRKTRAEIDIGNTIEYDVKSYQVKMTIIRCKNVRQKGLKLNPSQKKMLIYSTYM